MSEERARKVFIMPESNVSAEEIFSEFKEHSISEFFRKNSQMLGYSGKVKSLTTIVHEYVTNSLDACEEAGILPDISVEIKQISESKYGVLVKDNGPGIPIKIVGKALARVLAGTKFHRYIQQRGQQGIGAAGCTLFALITTGKPIHVISSTGKQGFECDISIDIKTNSPVVDNVNGIGDGSSGLSIYGEFGEVKYERSDHGVYEYLKRTALSNPHISLKLVEPDGKDIVFPRAVDEMPKKPKLIKPHPLGVGTNDLLEFAHRSTGRKISQFLIDTFSRVSQGKIAEIKELVPSLDLDKEPRNLKWDDAESIVDAFKKIKWIAPELDSVSPIGEEQIKVAIKNILNPEFISVIERKPRVFRGGIPFVVEAGIAYGRGAGKMGSDGGAGGNVLRFANKVPLLFDGSSCAITEAVKGIQWKRYGISNFDEEPVSVFVNVSGVYIPYSGVGKQAIAQEEEIIDEIKLAVMDCARNINKYIRGIRNRNLQESKYKTIMRYVNQLSSDLSDITGREKEEIKKSLEKIIEGRYESLFKEEEGEDEQQPVERGVTEE